jgi:hypothetical protein
MKDVNISELTLEQKVVLRLAELGFLTSAGDIQRALREFQYANYMISPINDDGTVAPDNNDDGIPDTGEDAIIGAPGLGDCECDGDHIIVECEHQALTKEEIQEVFDNDYK